jgi:hypothetical protein
MHGQPHVRFTKFLIKCFDYVLLIYFGYICVCASYEDDHKENISGKTKVVTNKFSVKHYTL